MARNDPPGHRPAFVLALFLAIHVCLNIDRSILSIVMEPIKKAFALKDTQLGLLSLGFAFFFGLAGIPLGRIADRGARKLLLATSVIFFSLMTAAGGLATNLFQLLASRFAVGAGEAGGGPSMLSMISDLYPAEKRASAISIYYFGPPLGFILTFLCGGWLAAHLGWRAVFMTAAVPGLLLAGLALLVLKEPTRGQFDAGGDSGSTSWGTTFGFLLRQPALRHVLVTTFITSGLSAAIVSWSVSFLVRSHGLTLPQAGLAMATFYGVTGIGGAWLGGWLTDRLSRLDKRWKAWTCGLFVACAAPALVCFLLAPSLSGALIALGCWSLSVGGIYGPGVALAQTLAPARMRGMVAALFYLVSNFMGIGVGPLLAGIISDVLNPAFGKDSLKYALLWMALGYGWAALHFWLAGRTVEADIARASIDMAAQND